MLQSRTYSRWQQAANAQSVGKESNNTQQIDLAKPDASAVELAENLQTITTNSLFTRIALVATKWIIRPLLWWPIKYLTKVAWWSLRNTNVPDLEERRRRNELWNQSN